MNVAEYYKRVSTLISSPEMEGSELSAQIKNYLVNEDDESPRYWVPLVQEKLLESAHFYNPSAISSKLLKLYLERHILDGGYIKRSELFFLFVVSLMIGIGLGWLFWA